MITKQHTALYFLALATKRNTTEDDLYKEFEKKIPFVLLPDAIRMYVGPRQAGHFEKMPEEKASWMKYPSAEVLKELTKENAGEKIQYHIEGKYPKCVIGEQTDIDVFDNKNWDHKFYHELRIHMLQDSVLDSILRERMINPSMRFADKFQIRHTDEIIDGAELRKQVAKFEEYGFFRLIGAVYNRTGVLLNRTWFDEHVLQSLLKAYPEDLARNTYQYMQISEEENIKINNLMFTLSDEQKAEVKITENLEDIFDEMYAEAYWFTVLEI